MTLTQRTPALYLTFLRPLALPRAATLNRFLSTSSPSEPQSASSTSSNSPVTVTNLPASPKSQLPYAIERTPSAQLPIYHLAKRGGNMKQTKVRKLHGDISVLRTELQEALGLEEKEVVINQLTRQIIIKGWRKSDVAKFMLAKQF